MAYTNGTSKPAVPIWINSAALPPPSSPEYLLPVISAHTGATVHHAHSATPEQALDAVAAASAAFKTWRKTSYAARRTILLKAAEIYERRLEEMAGYAVAETSCPEGFAKFNVKFSVDSIREIAAATSEIRGTVPQAEDESVLALVVKEPIGPVLIIPPWNGSIILATRAITSVLAAGCTIVLKASELCPRTHHAIVEAFEEAGLPRGVLNQIQVRREDAQAVTEAVIAHRAIRKVEFIGSANVGRVIGQLCAKYLKPILMELGGKGPAIVLDDADLEKTAGLCAQGATLHHGQLCFSTERIIVLRSVCEPFVEHLTKAFASLESAGSAVNETGAKHAHDVLVDAQKNGARFLVGGPEFTGRACLKPTLVTDVTSKSRIWDEETFGPSATVYVAEDEEDAIARANDSAYGLNAAIHSTSWERAMGVARELEYAQVHVNSLTVNDQQTFCIGGVKGSGWGRSNSKWGIEEFVVEKTIAFHATQGAKLFSK